MGWCIGEYNGREIGYGVPAECDQPGCREKIDRGLGYVCGGEPYGGEAGCGLFFCEQHRRHWRKDKPVCSRCANYRSAYSPKPDTDEWIKHKLTDPTWQRWCQENPDWVVRAVVRLAIGHDVMVRS